MSKNKSTVGQIWEHDNGSRVFHSYAIDFMDALAETLDEPPRLVFMDPPFNMGFDYGAETEDDQDPDDYEYDLTEWLKSAQRLSENSVWMHLPDRWAANAITIGRDALEMYLENWIIWHYRFGQCRSDRFINSKAHGLWFSSNGNPYVDVEFAQVPSDRASQYDDPRSDGTRMDLDVWGFDRYWGRVQGNNKERHNPEIHPNQLPEKYLQKIIGTLTEQDDIIVDPFSGSGTTAVVAQAMGRRFMVADASKERAESTVERIKKGAVRV